MEENFKIQVSGLSFLDNGINNSRYERWFSERL